MFNCSEKHPSQDIKSDVRSGVKEYYGKTLKTSDDLSTTASCTRSSCAQKKYVLDAIKEIHPEVLSKYFGCGFVVPENVEGKRVLDLGCGSGRDCYILAKLVGKDGFVTGIDMTDEQLDTANKYIDYHRDAFGFNKSNVKFVKGFIENLKDADIEDNSIDIIISNCVINLCKDKKSVLEEAFRVLKEGGEMIFGDMYVDRLQSSEIVEDKVLWGEGLAGALYWEQLHRIVKEIGFEAPRLFSARIIEIKKAELKALVGEARFASVVYRMFKLPENAKKELAEVTYKGEIPEHECEVKLDHNFKFQKGIPVRVDGDTAAILQHSRFKDQFDIGKVKPDSTSLEFGKMNPFNLAR